MPIKCPICEGVAIASGGSRRQSATLVRKYYRCKICFARIPVNVEMSIDHKSIKKGR